MYIVLLVTGVCCNVLAQLLLKQGMRNLDLLHHGEGLLPKIFSAATNLYVLGALAAYGFGFAIYSFVIAKMELSRAYPAASVMAILMLSLVSMLFLKEAVTAVKITGLSFCILGIVLVLS